MKRVVFLVVCLFLCVFLFSCGALPSPSSIVGEVLASVPFPSGRIYDSGVDETSERYMSSELISNHFGVGSDTYEFSLIDSCAVYLSARDEPCELAVFLCRAKSDTAIIADMCLERIELLHDYFGSLGINYRVEICGKYVVMAVCDKPETAVKRAISVISHS